MYSSYVHALGLALLATLITDPVLPTTNAAVPQVDVTSVTARADELFKRRDQPGVLAQIAALLDPALARAPNDYELLWRVARADFWRSDDPDLSMEDRVKAGKVGWDVAERAVAQNPNRVEGHFWAVGTMGNYALGLGIVKALTQRIEGKFLARIQAAERIDPRYADGAIPVAWGRYYDKLPWPKRDVQKSIAYYRKVFEINPYSLRARYYLAELELEEGNVNEAKRLIDEIAAAPVGRYDAPEERRFKLMGARLVPRVMEKLQ